MGRPKLESNETIPVAPRDQLTELDPLSGTLATQEIRGKILDYAEIGVEELDNQKSQGRLEMPNNPISIGREALICCLNYELDPWIPKPGFDDLLNSILYLRLLDIEESDVAEYMLRYSYQLQLNHSLIQRSIALVDEQEQLLIDVNAFADTEFMRKVIKGYVESLISFNSVLMSHYYLVRLGTES